MYWGETNPAWRTTKSLFKRFSRPKPSSTCKVIWKTPNDENIYSKFENKLNIKKISTSFCGKKFGFFKPQVSDDVINRRSRYIKLSPKSDDGEDIDGVQTSLLNICWHVSICVSINSSMASTAGHREVLDENSNIVKRNSSRQPTIQHSVSQTGAEHLRWKPKYTRVRFSWDWLADGDFVPLQSRNSLASTASGQPSVTAATPQSEPDISNLTNKLMQLWLVNCRVSKPFLQIMCRQEPDRKIVAYQFSWAAAGATFY